ncbi:hypothetical protein AVEN_131773-1, partial [Araneus ventricosus]
MTRNFTFLWPPMSLDTTPMKFWLREYLKFKEYTSSSMLDSENYVGFERCHETWGSTDPSCHDTCF